eukprot:scaffold650806_cov38-Prasinocladus_malaysianus.AAC.1
MGRRVHLRPCVIDRLSLEGVDEHVYGIVCLGPESEALVGRVDCVVVGRLVEDVCQVERPNLLVANPDAVHGL